MSAASGDVAPEVPASASTPPVAGGGEAARPHGEQFFLLMSIIIGVLSGLLVVCFRVGIEWVRLYLLGSAVPPAGARLILVPGLIGLAVAAMVALAFPRVRGSGVNQTKAALYIYDGYVSFRTVVGKFITSALAIGSGFSLGPEDPSLQIGAGVASLLGRWVRLDREKLRLIAPVGAAAGLAAAFNAPISAVLFVIEEVIGRWSVGVLGAVVLSAVASTVVERWFLGFAPLFHVPTFGMFRLGELLAYAVLGVVGGFASVVFAKGIEILRPWLKAQPRWTQFFQPAAAGVLVGVIGYLGFPQIMGAGYEFVDQALHDQYTWQVLGILAGLKILSTTLSFVSGTPGGMFAPTLFIGAMLGGAVGGVEHLLSPNLPTSTAAYALVGIGVLFAGFLRAPMTSVFMVLEVSGNYSIIVPVMIANTLAYLVSRNLQPTPIFDLLSRQDGLDLPSMEEEREQLVLRIEDAMRPAPVPVLEAGLPLNEALRLAQSSAEKVFLVRLPPGGWNLARREELLQLASLGQGELPLGSLLPPRSLPPLHPDHPLDTALRHVYDWPLLPVVHRADFQKLEGVITVEGILEAYRRNGSETLSPVPAPRHS